MPFVPGHEVVGRAARRLRGPAGRHPRGRRPRADLRRPRRRAVRRLRGGRTNRCSRITVGHLSPGLQTGFCKDTGGGWGQQLSAHRSQLHAVPDALTDEQALLLEPVACAVHTALRAGRRPTATGCWSAAPARSGCSPRSRCASSPSAGEILVVAKHGHQRSWPPSWAPARSSPRARCCAGCAGSPGPSSSSPSFSSPYLLGGVDVAIDAGRQPASRWRPRCRPPAPAAAWCSPACPPPPTCPRRGSASSRSSAPTPRPSDEVDGRSAFDIATELVAHDAVARLAANVASYPLHRWREALDHAHAAGRLGTVKVAFDPRSTR